jgi:carboxypeptidase Taq
MNAAYDLLCERFRRIATLGEASAMLGWDAAAMMPSGGAAARGDQLAVLAGVAHEKLVDPVLLEWFEGAQADDAWQTANLHLMRQAHVRATAVPAALVEAQARANSACEKIWRQARTTSDFALVKQSLAEVVRLVREHAACLASALNLAPYDALMDGFQPGISSSDVAPIFAAYEVFLRQILPQVEARQAAGRAPAHPQGPFSAAAQEALCRRLSKYAGLNFDHARLDRSAHPFCGGTPSDVRITTRYDEADFTQSLMGVLHETGHALYERGLPPDYARLPVGTAAGMAAHESQSLIIEMQACRSDGYLTWLGPQLQAAFGVSPEVAKAENLALIWRRVERGFIRVDADEITYPAHVILRFRLEQALISGDLPVADLPGAWNEGMRDLLGIVPPDDARGCLQDIHWYDGSFGYFPSYTLGAMAAAQLMAAARRDCPDLDFALARGDLSVLTGWLATHIHSRGSLLGFNDLLREATGKALDPSDFQAHLRSRYLPDATLE